MPALYWKLSDGRLSPSAEAVVFGLAILGGGFLISWGCEAAEVEVPPGLAIALLALIAVLPEYAVDMTLAWKAGKSAEYAPYAIANMTGANRLLIGLGWPLVVLLLWLRTKAKAVELRHT